MTTPMIELHRLSFSYAGETTLADINARIEKNEFVAIIGPSGCGKSTLLRLVGGLLLPTSGTIRVDGRQVTGPGLDRAMVFQEYSLFPWSDCTSNIMLALEQKRPELDRASCRLLAEEYLNMVGLAGKGRHLPGELSGGMRQRAAIARALALDAPILLMDEPFGALDAIIRARQQEMLLDIWQAGGEINKTVLFVTHDVDEALFLATRILVLGVCPGHVAADIKVGLPYPRSRREVFHSSQFFVLRDELLRELDLVVTRQLEAGYAFQGGEGI